MSPAGTLFVATGNGVVQYFSVICPRGPILAYIQSNATGGLPEAYLGRARLTMLPLF